MLQDFLVALALLMIIEGILPFLNPGKWKNVMSLLVKQTDKFIRIIGLISMLCGAIFLYVLK